MSTLKAMWHAWQLTLAEDVVESLIDKLMRIESLRGTGRLFLP